MLKVCFIGTGSMGKRHIENLASILADNKISFVFDALRSSASELSPDIAVYINRQYFSVSKLPNDYDIVFVTNPTHLHFKTLYQIKGKTKNVFIEKPIFDICQYDLTQIQTMGICYVACPLRYTKIIQYVKNVILKKEKVCAVRVICSSYLPEWRVGDYTQCYSAKREQGGGVSLDLIHEWDYICYLFGLPSSIYRLAGKYSGLKISSDDLAIYIADFEDKLVSLHLDYFGRKDRREIELFTNDDVITVDILEKKISYQKTGHVLEFSEERNDYQKQELLAFLDMIKGSRANENNMEHAYGVLKITTGE